MGAAPVEPEEAVRSPRILAVVALVAVVLIVAWPRARNDAPVTVFAAASLADALEGFARRNRDDGGRPLRFSFAASSTLARQIDAGAGADIFVSASGEWIEHLLGRGRLNDEAVRRPVGNRLVLVARRGAPPLAPADIERRLGTQGRLAVGDPDHVPAGRYARQALERGGQWPRLEPRLARADNVRAALALVARGDAPLGIVYATDAAVAAGVEAVARFDEGLHDPIVYHFALVGDAPTPAAREVFEALTGEAGLAALEEHGFVTR